MGGAQSLKEVAVGRETSSSFLRIPRKYVLLKKKYMGTHIQFFLVFYVYCLHACKCT